MGLSTKRGGILAILAYTKPGNVRPSAGGQMSRDHPEVQLSETKSGDFDSAGFLGPVNIFEAQQCKSIVGHFEDSSLPAPAEWWKGHAVTDRFVFDIATDREILSRVESIIGPDVVLWGVQYIRRAPEQEHPWHVDIETERAPDRFVSVWLGLANTTKQSGLKFVVGSHLFGKSIQQAATESKVIRAGMPENDALSLARRIAPRAVIAQPDVRDGDAIFFAGGMWHTSLNTTEFTRSALLLQFVAADVPVWIPDFTHLEWPFKYTDVRAPGVLVAGQATDGVHDLRSAPE